MTLRRGLLAAPLLLLAVLLVEVGVAVGRDYLPDPDGPSAGLVGEGRPGPPLRLTVLGDSTVRGVGAPTIATSLPLQVAERVAAELDRPVEVVGIGRSGATTRSVLEEQVPLLGATRPDAVLVVIGANDVTHLNPWWTMRARTRDLLAGVRAAVPGATPIVLGGVPQFGMATATAQPLRWLLDVLGARQRPPQAAAAGDEGAAFVDIATLASPRFVGVPESMSADGFHPSEVGYGFWADALAPAVAGALS